MAEELKNIVGFLDKEIEIDSVEDSCANGLQVEGRRDITNVGIATDVTVGTIMKAIENKCELIVSHHALIWSPINKLTGLMAKKLSLLMKNDISLYVAHLPLDIHRKLSHSINIADELGLYGISKFGLDKGNYFGVYGSVRRPVQLSAFKEMIDKKLKTSSRIFNYGNAEVSHVAILSGRNGKHIEDAVSKGIDCYITGEMNHSDLLVAKDLKINVILAGHYETETLGMVKLSRLLTKKFKIQCFFLDS